MFIPQLQRSNLTETNRHLNREEHTFLYRANEERGNSTKRPTCELLFGVTFYQFPIEETLEIINLKYKTPTM